MNASMSSPPPVAVAPVPPGDLAALIAPVLPLTAVCTVQQAGERFLEPAVSGLLSLPIVERGRVLGCVTRHALMMRVYMQPYGRELHARRPVTTLMNPAPLVIPVDSAIEAAGALIGARIKSPITEDFVVTDTGGDYVGMGVVLDVLRALEARVSEHTQELESAYRRLKASQNQLIQSEKLASLGQLVAGLAHEINTPLGYVQNNVEMVRNHLPAAAETLAAYAGVLDAAAAGADDATAAQCTGRLDDALAAFDPTLCGDLTSLLDDTLHGVHQIADLVASLKDYSRIDQARSENVDLHGLVESALRIGGHLLRRRDVQVRRQFGDVPPVTCAPAQINQVLLNLIGNAAQAIEHDRGIIAVRTQVSGGYALIAVQDNGKGIPADVLPRVFEPFFTTKPVGQGTGLGLSICQQIVQAHGGRIAATSTPGVGTRFVVALPIAGRNGARA